MKFWEAMKALEEEHAVRRLDLNEPILPNHVQGSEYEMDFTTERELYEEPVKTYKFWELIPALKQGKKVKRKSWNSDIFVQVRPATGRVILENSSFHTLLLEDYEADDWVICE